MSKNKHPIKDFFYFLILGFNTDNIEDKESKQKIDNSINELNMALIELNEHISQKINTNKQKHLANK